MDNAPYALEISPASELTFTLSRTSTGPDATPRCTLTLRHPGNTDEHLAFKVKTTQPRRYLVRPNQGLVAPHSAETISILLVEKDKQVLLQSYDRLGQSALDHSKDKFLVQSCCVSREFAMRYISEKGKADMLSGDAAAKANKDLAEALTGMWNAVTSGGSNPVYNKKLHVRHVVPTAQTAAVPSTAKPPVQSHDKSLAAIENMSPEQMFAEVSSLRRRYDELVSFSVNLTAERDILNNTLEQTKRDLNREMASRAALENKQGGGRGVRGSAMGAGGSGTSATALLVQLMVVGIACFLAGVRLTQNGQVGFLEDIPVIGGYFVADEAEMNATD